jgi:lysine 2,3-aminomutase
MIRNYDTKEISPGKIAEGKARHALPKGTSTVKHISKPYSLKSDFEVVFNKYLEMLWQSNEDIYLLLRRSKNVEMAREQLYDYLFYLEREIFDIDNDMHILEKATQRDAINVFKSILGPTNEKTIGYSDLDTLWKLAHKNEDIMIHAISIGFLMEFIKLFGAVAGKSYIYSIDDADKLSEPEFLRLNGREAALARTAVLDDLGTAALEYYKKFPSGLEEDIIKKREENKQRILNYFNGNEEDWNNYKWHLRNVIRTAKPFIDLLEMSEKQKEAIKKAVANSLPFGVTPYYLSLMDYEKNSPYDHAIRQMVFPSEYYVDKMSEYRAMREYKFDFMGEHDTSPVDLVTRRYPHIAIFKPFNTCAQICVYCQRNWEIDQVLDPKALASTERINKALAWFDEHKNIGEVLVTGGDPLVMKNNRLEYILKELAKKDHIYRIRIGTRTPVVMPMRWTDNLMNIIGEIHNPPKLEVSVVTHFIHSYEITPEALKAVQKIRKQGISCYNQEVFTINNSRRFESVKLRRDLKSIGVDPYYTFNMKGKDETKQMMVPIARILQERKEEARLLPGLDRTDEPVFNVPRLGKNHLRAMQDHRIIGIKPNGSRVYEFHPWEKNIDALPPYNYTDVPIYNYLEELAKRGENPIDYRTIWYYY